MIALDCETTGLDFWHGAKPFLVTIAYEDGGIDYWEWDVNPITRQPTVIKEDVEEIKEALDGQEFVAHNAKFDIRALETIGIEVDWNLVHDSTVAAHIINSSKPKDLASLILYYLDKDIKKYETHLNKVVEKARRLCRTHFPDWRIASKDLPEIPSAKETVWKNDLWLPKALCKAIGEPKDGELFSKIELEGYDTFNTITATYANVDSGSLARLYPVLCETIENRGQWKNYLARLKDLQAIYEMEEVGITINDKRRIEKVDEYGRSAKKSSIICRNFANRKGFKLELPDGGRNNSLAEFVFDVLKMPVVKKTKTGNPSMDKDVKQEFIETTEGEVNRFFVNLDARSKRVKAISDMQSYKRFMLPHPTQTFIKTKNETLGQWFVLHPSVNSTGTITLRSSSQNPSEQIISKKEGFNLRYCFGPAPGREWWSLDYNNLELRIPAYESEEPAMLDLFECPDNPPFFGSYHLLIFSILYPKEFRAHGDKVKDVYKSTLYQWTKNGNFAELYGAIDTGDGKSTADRTFHFPGAQAIVSKKLRKKAALNRKYIDLANRYGYVETLPDRTVDPERGYPLHFRRGRYNSISPTEPLNYHVQGTACWVKRQAMLKCREYLKTLKNYHIIMDVHDELVFDFPLRKNKGNMPVIKKVQKLMESCGDDVGIPLTVGIDFHPNNWSESE